MRLNIVLFALLGAVGPVLAQSGHEHHGAPAGERPAASAWTAQPLLLPVPGRRGERESAVLRPQGVAAKEVKVLGPAGGESTFPVTGNGARIQTATAGIGNYHRVIAREEGEQHVGVASTVWYFSNPGPSPARLLGQAMSELEIVPDPLPREHAAYRESEKWRFAVRFNGQPLAGQKVRLETEAGTWTTFEADGNGIVTVLFPRDFPEKAVTSGHGRDKANFVLSTEHQAGGRHYVTAFNYTYVPDADRGKSLAWGGAFGLAGMLCALPLLRRRQGSGRA